MRIETIFAERLFDGEVFHHNKTVHVEDGIISAIEDGATSSSYALPKGAIVAPGFVDLQVNGGGGVLFNDDPTPDGLAIITKAHRGLGTTSFLPTLISDTREKMKIAIKAVKEARLTNPALLGIHLEGPFLNIDRKGVHPASHILSANASDLDLLSSLKTGVTLVTLAPEKAPHGFIRELKNRGVIVSVGHTNGTAEETNAALTEGATGFTHLYNAMSQLNSREPGAVGACLAHEGCYAGIIADGIHVSIEALRIALKTKTPANLFLVSDAMTSLGANMKEFTLFGETIFVDGNRLSTRAGTLAGAQLDMASAVRFMATKVGAKIEHALQMATSTPAKFLNLHQKIGSIKIGARADFVMLDEHLNVLDTFFAGTKNGK